MAKFGFSERQLFNISDAQFEQVSSAPTILSGQTAIFAKTDDLMYFKGDGGSEQQITVGGTNLGSPTANPDGADIFYQQNSTTAKLEFRRLISSNGTVNFTTSANEVDISVDLSDINDELDHGLLLGLADDDHLQYLLLAGRAGGQTAYGGTAASNNLILRSTSHATKGHVKINDGSALIVDFTSDAYQAAIPDSLIAAVPGIYAMGKGFNGAQAGTDSSIGYQNFHARTSFAAPSFISSNDLLAYFNSVVWNGTDMYSKEAARIEFRATETHSASGYGTGINFNTTKNGATTTAATMKLDGNGQLVMARASGANIIWNTDGGGDVGASGANRPDKAFVKTTINLDSLTASLPVVSDASKNLVSMSYASFAGNLDHGLLLGLGDDDHTQYLLLAGRSGGQIANGGTASGDDLELRSTAHATKGTVKITDGSEFQHADNHKQQYEVQTTDATVTSIAVIPLTDDRAYQFKVMVVSRRSDGGGQARSAVELQACAYRAAAGAATLQGSVKQNFENKSANVSVDIDVNANDLRVRVTGIAAQTFEWTAYVEYLESN